MFENSSPPQRDTTIVLTVQSISKYFTTYANGCPAQGAESTGTPPSSSSNHLLDVACTSTFADLTNQHNHVVHSINCIPEQLKREGERVGPKRYLQSALNKNPSSSFSSSQFAILLCYHQVV